MPPEASEQAERLLQPDMEPLYQWKEGEEESSEEDAQWQPRQPPTRWQRLWTAFWVGLTPALTLVMSVLVVVALFLLLTHNGMSMSTQTQNSSKDTKDTNGSSSPPALPQDDPVIYLHPEDHIHREPQTIHLAWNITRGELAPDGVIREVILINGAFPGPTIEARTGDMLVVTVTNSLPDEAISLHWHGLHMRGANHMDGPVGVNQCAIPANGGSFVYEVPTEDQAGTFWYHAHSELQRADGMYGGLVIHEPEVHDPPKDVSSRADSSLSVPEGPDREILFLVGDCYHFPGRAVYAVFEDPTSNGKEPVPESLLLNGRGAYDCSLAAPATPVNCHEVALPRLLLDKTLRYRVRLVNVGVLTGVSAAVLDAQVDVLSVDGGLPVVVPEAVRSQKPNSVGVVYPAQRVDFLLWWPTAEEEVNDNAATDSQLVLSLDGEYYVGNLQSPPVRCFSIGEEAPAALESSSGFPTTTIRPVIPVDLAELQGPVLAEPLLDPDQLYMIFAVVEVLSHNRFVPHGYINHTMWLPQDLPLLSLDRSAWDSHQLVPWTGRDPAWVELTINNIDTQGHPFHLHGFDFYVVGTHAGLGGWDYYNPFAVPWKPPRGGAVNVASPVLRDTVYVPPYGYVILRFRADNPGLWVLHCHILWHQASGMSMAFQVGGYNEHGFGGTPASLRAAEYCRTRGVGSDR